MPEEYEDENTRQNQLEKVVNVIVNKRDQEFANKMIELKAEMVAKLDSDF